MFARWGFFLSSDATSISPAAVTVVSVVVIVVVVVIFVVIIVTGPEMKPGGEWRRAKVLGTNVICWVRQKKKEKKIRG